MPTFFPMRSFNEKYQQLKEYRAAGYPDMDEAAENGGLSFVTTLTPDPIQ